MLSCFLDTLLSHPVALLAFCCSAPLSQASWPSETISTLLTNRPSELLVGDTDRRRRGANISFPSFCFRWYVGQRLHFSGTLSLLRQPSQDFTWFPGWPSPELWELCPLLMLLQPRSRAAVAVLLIFGWLLSLFYHQCNPLPALSSLCFKYSVWFHFSSLEPNW